GLALLLAGVGVAVGLIMANTGASNPTNPDTSATDTITGTPSVGTVPLSAGASSSGSQAATRAAPPPSAAPSTAASTAASASPSPSASKTPSHSPSATSTGN